IRQKNDLLPDLRFTSRYEITGLGSQLDGNGVFPNGMTNNAFRSLASNHFDSWELGFTLNVPIGFRAEHANLRDARLRLARSYLVVKAQDAKTGRRRAREYRPILEHYDVIIARRAQRQAFAQQLEARFKEFVAGKTTADFLLEAQRQWAASLSDEFTAV